MNVNTDRSKATCDYCGNVIYLDNRSDEQKAYEINKGRLKAQAEYDELTYARAKKQEKAAKRKRRRRTIIIRFVVFCIFVLPIIIAISAGILFYTNMPNEDAFSLVKVSFSGMDGKGVPSLELVDNELTQSLSLSDFDYTFDKKKDLWNDDTIVLRIETNVVNVNGDFDCIKLSGGSRKYKVSGLSTYVADINTLSDKTCSIIEGASSDVFVSQKQYSSKASYDNRVHVGMYLRFKKGTNLLYDVYKVTYKDTIAYCAVYYEDLFVKSDGSIVWNDRGLSGNMIWCEGYKVLNGYPSLNACIDKLHATEDESWVYTERIFG